MSWLKIDDGFFEHEKIEDLSHQAFRIHVGGLCLCARLLTDGRITPHNLRKITAAARISNPKRYIEELIAARLWSELPSGGWKIKDYLDYNPSSIKVKEQRQRNAERQSRHRVIHRDIHRSNGVTNGVSHSAPSPTPINTKNQEHITPLASEDELANLSRIEDFQQRIGRSM